MNHTTNNTIMATIMNAHDSACRSVAYYTIITITILLMLIVSTAQAATLYLKPGQSKTIRLNDNIGTVFVSNPTITNYKVVSDNTVTIYAKQRGYTDLIIYDRDDNVVIHHAIDVDPIIPDLHYRIKQNFPQSDVKITRFLGGETGNKVSYLLSGSVPDDHTRDSIYALVGSVVGTTDDKNTQDYKSEQAGDLFFLSRIKYQNLVDRIQITKDNQVNVKLTLVEVSKEFTNSLGVEWQNLTLDSIISGGTNISSVGTFNLLGLKHGFDIKNVATIIRAVENDSLAKVLAEPNLTVLSGEVAEFLVGGEIPIVTASGNSNNSSTVTYKDYGIKLAIGAKVSNENIRLFIDNEFSSLSGSYAFNDYQIPTLTTRRTRSTIELKNGDSFIISGLVSEQDVENLTKVPFLGDIPILGALARSASTNRSRKELVVFATVKLVNPNSSFNDAYIPTFERTDYRNIFFNINNNHDKQGSESFPISNESERFLTHIGFLE